MLTITYVYIGVQNWLPLWVTGRPVCLAADLSENVPTLVPGFNNTKVYIKKKRSITSFAIVAVFLWLAGYAVLMILVTGGELCPLPSVC